ncbi:PLP-dependent aminotransferase family protein [Cellulosimicrobium sp. I38E]|uniref:MocR-like pyridoxine biosynthesis transcription factor PdxR n=1 Tax=Cellulosimicrobium sp. I38E TaxID=1393139 RepID=UPI0007DA1239|nr:PLP-dependent aminotransferase family protein [Cellulosimicrobium sp. I38E]
MGEIRANPSLAGALDLHLALSPTRPARSLQDALRTAVLDGRLVAGTRLPAARALAADLGVARGTVADAYAQLAAEGWLESRVGAGTWVGRRVVGPTPAPPSPGRPRLPLDLRAGVPDPSSFPRGPWLAAARRALADAPDAALGYGDPRGAEPLRVALAAYLGRARGVRTDPDRVVVTHGFADLLSLVARALVARGARRAAVEQYGHAAHRAVLAAAGLEVVALPVDDGGADVSLLDALGRERPVEVVLLTPAHQFPTGVPLSPARRGALVAWAARTGATVVEDDYDGELRYDRRAVGALQALAPDHVVYAGTASKALAPGVGLAWGAVPAGLLDDVVAQRRVLGGSPDAIGQLTLARFLADHEYDRAVRRARARYRARRERLATLVAEHLPGGRLLGLPAGLQAVLELPPGTDEDAVVDRAARRGAELLALGAYAVEPGLPGAGAPTTGSPPPSRAPAVVVGYGAPRDHQVEQAFATLLREIDPLSGTSPRRSSRGATGAPGGRGRRSAGSS